MWMHCNDSSGTIERVSADWVLTLGSGEHYYVTFLIEPTPETGNVFQFFRVCFLKNAKK